MNLNDLIKENPSINLTVSVKDLLEFGQTIANQTAREVLNKQEEKVLSRVDVLKKLKICSTTLWRWEKIGLIKGKMIGGRKYYNESEIKRMLSLERTER